MKRPRGRPRKYPLAQPSIGTPPPKRPRGRPRKYPLGAPPQKRPRGRPRKEPLAQPLTGTLPLRGRPRKDTSDQPRASPMAQLPMDTPIKRLRGRPRKEPMTRPPMGTLPIRERPRKDTSGQPREHPMAQPLTVVPSQKRPKGRPMKQPVLTPAFISEGDQVPIRLASSPTKKTSKQQLQIPESVMTERKEGEAMPSNSKMWEEEQFQKLPQPDLADTPTSPQVLTATRGRRKV